MKKTVKQYFITITALFISLLLFTLIITILRFNTNYSFKTLKTISLIGSSILFLFAAILNGKLHKKRGLLHGVIMSSLYLIIVLIFKIFNVKLTITSIIIKLILLIIGNIIGVNI